MALLSAWLALQDLGRLAHLLAAQLTGAPQGSDFLNLYAGAWLLVHAPASLYDPSAQLAVQQRIGWQGPLVPFLLPPYAAVFVGWLGLSPYSAAYVVWLGLGVTCVVVAARLLAPRPWLLWLPLGLLFLPCFLGLAQGQTAALALLGFAAVTRLLLAPSSSAGSSPNTARGVWRAGVPALVAVSALGWLLKPQLAVLPVVALLLARRRAAIAMLAVLVIGLTLLALVWIGPIGPGAYAELSSGKLQEALTSEPTYLPGPTLLHASQSLLGPGVAALLLACGLVVLALVAFGAIWRRGLAKDDAAWSQLAALPVAATLCAPYALAHELTVWLGSLWLLWRYTRTRPWGRAGLLWLAAAVWLAGDLAVALPTAGGADVAALLGLVLLGTLAGYLARR